MTIAFTSWLFCRLWGWRVFWLFCRRSTCGY